MEKVEIARMNFIVMQMIMPGTDKGKTVLSSTVILSAPRSYAASM